MKIFMANMGQRKCHQLIIVSNWEMGRVLFSLEEVFGKAKRWFLNSLDSRESLKRDEIGMTRQFQLANYPTPGGQRKL